jgi:hypothetical protein
MSVTAIEGAAAAFSVAENANANDALVSLRSAVFRCASANGIVETPIRRSR